MAAADADLDRAFADIRARVPAFIANHLGWRGSLRLHRAALGVDLFRAPLNVLLVGPALVVRLAGRLAERLGLRRFGGWLQRRQLFLDTHLARQMAHLAADELLGLDAHGDIAPEIRTRIEGVIADYVTARHAVAEFAAGLVVTVTGLLLVHRITPGALSLGPLLADASAQTAAIDSFWAGSWLGGIYYGFWPVHADWTTRIATTVGVMVCFAFLATFIGLVTDPLQTALGWHKRRILHLVDTVERLVRGESSAKLRLPDPWLPRAADLADALALAIRTWR